MSKKPDADLQKRAIEILKTIIDPELPINIWDLGLVYGVKVLSSLELEIVMTLTSPTCPAIDFLPSQIAQELEENLGLKRCLVTLVWEPKWNPKLLDEEVQIELGLI